MSYKKVITSLLVVVGLSSCISIRKQNYLYLKNAILNKDNIINHQMLFVHTDKKETIGSLSAYELRSNLLYGQKYKNCNPDSLLSKILKGEYMFPFNTSELSRCFELSSYVTDCYMRQSVKSFLSQFTRYNKERKKFVVQPELTEQEKLSVIYFLYFNGYYTSYDDYVNRFFATKGIKKPVKQVVKVKIIE